MVILYAFTNECVLFAYYLLISYSEELKESQFMCTCIVCMAKFDDEFNWLMHLNGTRNKKSELEIIN